MDTQGIDCTTLIISNMSDAREVQDPPYPLANLPSSSSPDTSDLETPSPQTEIKDDNQVFTSEQNGESEQSESQYISGFALWVNMVSLMLSIFLIALDMVGFFFSLSFLSFPFHYLF